MRHTKIIATVGPGERHRRDARRADCRRHRHLPSQFLARHARVAGGDVRAGPRGARRAPCARSRSCRISAVRRFAPGGSRAARPITLEAGRAADDRHRRRRRRTRAALRRPSPALRRSVRPGDRLLLADGRVELRVESTDGARDSDDGGRGRRDRRAQGHQRAGRAAAGVGDHAEGRRRPDVRPVARRRHGRAQLRADAPPTCRQARRI